MNVAFRYFLNGRYEDAIRMTRKTIDIAKATNHPDQVGPALTVVARAELARGQLDDALAAAHEASQTLERFADSHRHQENPVCAGVDSGGRDSGGPGPRQPRPAGRRDPSSAEGVRA